MRATAAHTAKHKVPWLSALRGDCRSVKETTVFSFVFCRCSSTSLCIVTNGRRAPTDVTVMAVGFREDAVHPRSFSLSLPLSLLPLSTSFPHSLCTAALSNVSRTRKSDVPPLLQSPSAATAVSGRILAIHSLVSSCVRASGAGRGGGDAGECEVKQRHFISI